MIPTEPAQKKQKLESGGVKGFDGETHEYCKYTETSQKYDQTRAPLGLNIFVGTFSNNKLPLASQDLLDVGCGTGTFLDVVKGKFKSVAGVEYNDGMIGQARALLGDSVNLIQGAADKLPFDNDSFHAIAINQVLHHFPNDNNFEYLAKAMKECARVLKPGGYIVINTSTPEQQRDAFWWVELFGRSQDAITARFPPLDVLSQHMRDAGFSLDDDSFCSPLHRSLMRPSKYLENGIATALDKDYRDGDSSWSMAENFGELGAALASIEKMVADGTDKEFIARREQMRQRIGQATFVSAVL
jgi:SAM-dependent methyltransferase